MHHFTAIGTVSSHFSATVATTSHRSTAHTSPPGWPGRRHQQTTASKPGRMQHQALWVQNKHGAGACKRDCRRRKPSKTPLCCDLLHTGMPKPPTQKTPCTQTCQAAVHAGTMFMGGAHSLVAYERAAYTRTHTHAHTHIGRFFVERRGDNLLGQKREHEAKRSTALPRFFLCAGV